MRIAYISNDNKFTLAVQYSILYPCLTILGHGNKGPITRDRTVHWSLAEPNDWRLEIIFIIFYVFPSCVIALIRSALQHIQSVQKIAL